MIQVLSSNPAHSGTGRREVKTHEVEFLGKDDLQELLVLPDKLHHTFTREITSHLHKRNRKKLLFKVKYIKYIEDFTKIGFSGM